MLEESFKKHMLGMFISYLQYVIEKYKVERGLLKLTWREMC